MEPSSGRRRPTARLPRRLGARERRLQAQAAPDIRDCSGIARRRGRPGRCRRSARAEADPVADLLRDPGAARELAARSWCVDLGALLGRRGSRRASRGSRRDVDMPTSWSLAASRISSRSARVEPELDRGRERVGAGGVADLAGPGEVRSRPSSSRPRACAAARRGSAPRRRPRAQPRRRASLGRAELIEELLRAPDRRPGPARVLGGDRDRGPEALLGQLDRDRACVATCRRARQASIRSGSRSVTSIAIGSAEPTRPRHPRRHARQVVGELPQLGRRLHQRPLRDASPCARDVRAARSDSCRLVHACTKRRLAPRRTRRPCTRRRRRASRCRPRRSRRCRAAPP